ncbi:TIGR00730 family Rossman fold protein [Alloscardovia theropitheci]|uniref:Cytokinin riboside 5'-monophosphate phosphoribohydrolase n=1 Tax=Alloscardovia theropitheci TaxID=2496842 RepID=A0A4R0QYJ5_9BIFI|nr:TIGR00730 family Rossman fold protein [Alloscardovia theropitheci]TCD53546.1 TIGR00730 family Rossman fold protein [Alloscardovia theropitheci]
MPFTPEFDTDVEELTVAQIREAGDIKRLERIREEFRQGFNLLADLGPAICVFGSARIRTDSAEYEQGRYIGKLLAEQGFAVITGGGPGAMEAANRGAFESGGTSVGIGIELPREQGINPYVNLSMNCHYFFTRKTMFMRYCDGLIVLPGGMGTLDELFEVQTLVQTHKSHSRAIVLFGTQYWSGLINWLRDTVAVSGKVTSADLDRFILTDDPQEAVRIVTESAKVRH